MKKQFLRGLFLAILFCMTGILSMNAQSLQEVVYLKNGGVIRGTIIEQKPNESLKIQTVEGNVFVYQMDEVDKIAKEMPLKKTFNEVDVSTYGWGKAPRYRGFVGDSYILGTGHGYVADREFLYTSHGIQINPFFYAGAGVGVNYWLAGGGDDNDPTWSVPIFAHLRGELHRAFKKNVSPYLDAKIGYSFFDVEGLYFAPSVGCHFYFGHSITGLSVGFGYVMHNVNVYYSSSYYDKEVISGLEFTVAFDF